MFQPCDGPDAIYSRTRKLPGYVWNTSSAFGSGTTVPVASELYDSLFLISPSPKFRYAKWDCIKLRLTPNNSKFYRGLLAVSVIPFPMTNPSDFPVSVSPTALSTYPTTLIDASSIEVTEVAIPWVHPESKCRSTDIYQACVVIWVIAPLVCESAPGVAGAGFVSMEANFEGFHWIDPDNYFGLVANIERRALPTPTGSFLYAQGPKRTGYGVKQEAETKAEKGTISSALDSVSSIASYAAPLPIIGTFAAGLSVVSKAASSVFDWFGMSKVPNLSMPMYTMGNPHPFSNAFHGVVNADPLSSEQVPFVSTDPSLMTSSQDGCNLDTIKMLPTLIRTMTTSSTKLIGSAPNLLGIVPVAPKYSWGNDLNSQPSNLAYVARSFRRWRGGISYKFLVSSSMMTKVRLIISWSFERRTTFNELDRFCYYEINGTTSIDGVVPWLQSQPWLPLANTVGPWLDTGSSNGFLHIWQDTPVLGDTFAGTTSPPLTIAIFASGTETTQFASFQNPRINHNMTPGYKASQGYTPFLGFEQDMTLHGIYAEENIHSSREICHRPVMMYNNFTATDSFGAVPQNYLVEGTHAYYLKRFRFWRGSVTFVFSVNPSVIGTNLKFTFRRSGENVNGDIEEAYIEWFPAHQAKFSIIVPYDCCDDLGYGYLRTGVTSSAQYLSSLEIKSSDGSHPLTVSMHFNDDLSLGVMLHPPNLVPQT